MTKHAVALRDFGVNDARVTEGQVLRDLPENHFSDLESIEFVREATEEDLAVAPAAAAPPKPKAPRRRRKSSRPENPPA